MGVKKNFVISFLQNLGFFALSKILKFLWGYPHRKPMNERSVQSSQWGYTPPSFPCAHCYTENICLNILLVKFRPQKSCSIIVLQKCSVIASSNMNPDENGTDFAIFFG